MKRNRAKSRITVQPPVLYAYMFFGGVFSNVVLPSFYLGINWHPALIFALIISAFAAFDVARGGDVKLVKWIIFPVGLILLLLISDFYGKGHLGVLGDNSPLLNGLLMVFTFVPYFFALSRIELNIGDRAFVQIANISFCVIFLVSVFQAWGPQSLSETLIKLYSNDPHASNALAGIRYTLTGPDPNVGSAIAALFIILYFVLFLKYRKYKYLVFFAASLVPLFLAQGRTVMIGLAVCFILYLWFFSKTSLFYKITAFSVLVPLVLGVASVIDVEYLTRGLFELERGENGSINVRLQKAAIVFDSFTNSPIIGHGANLEQYGLVKNLDSEYLLLLQRHGIVGFVFVLGAIFYMAIISIGNLSRYWGAHVLLLLCGLAAFVMLTNVFVFNIDTFGYVLLMIYLSRFSKIKKWNDSQDQCVRGLQA